MKSTTSPFIGLATRQSHQTERPWVFFLFPRVSPLHEGPENATHLDTGHPQRFQGIPFPTDPTQAAMNDDPLPESAAGGSVEEDEECMRGRGGRRGRDHRGSRSDRALAAGHGT